MITTPVSARGLDFENVNVVVNYDLPSADHGGIREYVHRIGRTARIGHKGLAISFFNDKNSGIADDLTATLLEQGQTVPDFLEEHKPSNGTLVFTDDVVEEADAIGGDEEGWDAPADENGGGAHGGDDTGNAGGWGASAEETDGAAVADGGW